MQGTLENTYSNIRYRKSQLMKSHAMLNVLLTSHNCSLKNNHAQYVWKGFWSAWWLGYTINSEITIIYNINFHLQNCRTSRKHFVILKAKKQLKSYQKWQYKIRELDIGSASLWLGYVTHRLPYSLTMDCLAL